ncbi:MAG: 50S ribosomal protein L25 [Anaerolineaceae bacterium]|jgi:large subunit ribosomal protein L25|nr:50S ribosomal protein L25 [Anaerolineaceae bacterium]
MDKILIQASKRDVTGKKVGALRRQGKLPGVMYGHHMDPTPVIMDLREVSKALFKLSASSIVTVVMDGEEFPTLVREEQRDYIKNILTHVDFQVVSMKEKIRTLVTVELIGASPAVKNFNGVVIQNLNQIEVEALPNDLPDRLELNIETLEEIGSSLLVSDLEVSEDVTILTSLDETVVVIAGFTQELEEEEEEEIDEFAEDDMEPEISEQRGKQEEETEE